MRLSTSTSLVIVDVVVTDRNGNPIEGLGARDFALTEDGARQDIGILEFQKLEPAPQARKSYYILGYYTHNPKADGNFRHIAITCKADNIAKLDYRLGYYARPNAFGVGDAARGGADGSAVLDIKPPVLLHKFEAAYSEEARKAKYQGTAVLLVEIDASGQVASLRVLRSLGLGLDEKAVDAVRQWKFAPGIKDGKPVSVQAEVEVNFRLL
ncbi:MAG: TonB family protein [Bryobacteraceae bacterium]